MSRSVTATLPRTGAEPDIAPSDERDAVVARWHALRRIAGAITTALAVFSGAVGVGIGRDAESGDGVGQVEADLGLLRLNGVDVVVVLDDVDRRERPAADEVDLEGDLGMAAWYLVLDEGELRPERIRQYVEGVDLSLEVMASFVPNPYLDSSPLQALERTGEREDEIKELLYAVSVPIVGFLPYSEQAIEADIQSKALYDVAPELVERVREIVAATL